MQGSYYVQLDKSVQIYFEKTYKPVGKKRNCNSHKNELCNLLSNYDIFFENLFLSQYVNVYYNSEYMNCEDFYQELTKKQSCSEVQNLNEIALFDKYIQYDAIKIYKKS